MRRTISVVGLVAVLMSSVACGVSRIEPGQVGIKVTYGGSDRGVQDFPTQIGWVWYNPISTSVLEYPTSVRTAVWALSPNDGSPKNEEITFTNQDKMAISVDVNLSYHLDPTKIPAFYVKFRSDNLDTWTYGYLHNVARDTFNNHGGKYSIDAIMGDNAPFIADVRKSLQEELIPYGVMIDQFGIVGAPRPPQYVQDQINNSAHAKQLTVQKENELAQVRAEMAKESLKAQVYAQNEITKAEGVAKSNRLISESLTPQLIDKMRLEHWDGKLPYVNGAGVNPFVTIGK